MKTKTVYDTEITLTPQGILIDGDPLRDDEFVKLGGVRFETDTDENGDPVFLVDGDTFGPYETESVRDLELFDLIGTIP